jgi:hypothetical protein
MEVRRMSPTMRVLQGAPEPRQRSVAHIPIAATGLTWLHDILKEVVAGEQIVTPASRRRHAPVTPVSSKCGRIGGR